MFFNQLIKVWLEGSPSLLTTSHFQPFGNQLWQPLLAKMIQCRFLVVPRRYLHEDDISIDLDLGWELWNLRQWQWSADTGTWTLESRTRDNYIGQFLVGRWVINWPIRVLSRKKMWLEILNPPNQSPSFSGSCKLFRSLFPKWICDTLDVSCGYCVIHVFCKAVHSKPNWDRCRPTRVMEN